MINKIVLSIVLIAFSTFVVAGEYKVGDEPFGQLGKDSLGSEINLAEYKGKVVIISFWASWCGPCRKELPVLSGIQKRATRENLQVFSINIDEDKKIFRQLVAMLGDTPMIMISDARRRLYREFGVGGIPHMLIVDTNGKISSIHVGYGESQIPNIVEEIIAAAKEPAKL